MVVVGLAWSLVSTAGFGFANFADLYLGVPCAIEYPELGRFLGRWVMLTFQTNVLCLGYSLLCTGLCTGMCFRGGGGEETESETKRETRGGGGRGEGAERAKHKERDRKEAETERKAETKRKRDKKSAKKRQTEIETGNETET